MIVFVIELLLGTNNGDCASLSRFANRLGRFGAERRSRDAISRNLLVAQQLPGFEHNAITPSASFCPALDPPRASILAERDLGRDSRIEQEVGT